MTATASSRPNLHVAPTASNHPPRPGLVARIAQRLPADWRRRSTSLPGALAPPVEPGTPTPRIAIIGSGFGGIGLACRLRQAGIETFTVYEKADRLGGTWRDNTYPGAACDVPSHLYSLSFAPKLDWTRRFPSQPEILGYLDGVADEFQLAPHLRFGAEVTEVTFVEEDPDGHWLLRFADGTTEEADVVVAATGQLNRPYIPPFEGFDTFEGHSFHSARWDHDHDLTGRDVAVVGIGASAIQFVPEIVKEARSVTLFQRSVNYVAPKPDGPFSPRTLGLFGRLPVLAKLYRASIWARFEARWIWFRKGSKSAGWVANVYRKKLEPAATEALPVEALVPDYPLGCKRILISNDWYPAIFQPHVEVVNHAVERFEPNGVRAGGKLYEADTVIFGTGFQSTGFLAPMKVTGRGGADLHEAWRDGAEAHLGLTVTGFPNLFVLYGPNTNLGHNSIIFMLERQIGYVLSCVRRLTEGGAATLEVRPDAQAASNERLRRELARTVWDEGCHSWYKTESGRITNNWSGPTYRYWLRTAVPRWKDFTETARR
ncbi:MAG: NAD(P)/FAD-dependent oxidoreductase [Acidimicrobiales bacterium]|nr:NAD(P)/FAD-dependent oxidoreductase [Acidimicrobiales bacterium]